MPARIVLNNRSKYGNRKTTVDGHTFDSKREAERYIVLKARQKACEISRLFLQPKFHLIVNSIKIATYIADFCYCENGVLMVEDVKGVRTREYKLKKKLVLALHGIDVQEI